MTFRKALASGVFVNFRFNCVVSVTFVKQFVRIINLTYFFDDAVVEIHVGSGLIIKLIFKFLIY